MSDDEAVRSAFWKAIKASGLISEEIIKEGESLVGRQSQVKRWKFAQTTDAVTWDAIPKQEEEIQVLEGGKVILAGDGTGGEVGGIEGSWRSSQAAAKYILDWIHSNEANHKL